MLRVEKQDMIQSFIDAHPDLAVYIPHRCRLLVALIIVANSEIDVLRLFTRNGFEIDLVANLKTRNYDRITVFQRNRMDNSKHLRK
jgi:hypothetical protein